MKQKRRSFILRPPEESFIFFSLPPPRPTIWALQKRLGEFRRAKEAQFTPEEVDWTSSNCLAPIGAPRWAQIWRSSGGARSAKWARVRAAFVSQSWAKLGLKYSWKSNCQAPESSFST